MLEKFEFKKLDLTQETDRKKFGEEFGKLSEEERERVVEEARLEAGKIDKEVTNGREKGDIVERPYWGEFESGNIGENGDYKEPTHEQKEKFKKRIERVSEIFEKADFDWCLDGATNISLYGNRQIRHHKDLDVGIFEEDLEKLERLIAEQGFGIFINYKENGKNLMRPVGIEEIRSLESPDLSICKIGSEGVNMKSMDPFNFVDLHIHSKNSSGDVVISRNGAVLPNRFFEPTRKTLTNGKTVNLSQPIIVAYYKINSGRPRDISDLRILRKYLNKDDFQILKESVKIDDEKMEAFLDEKLQEIWRLLAPIIKLAREPKIIGEKLWTYPELKKRQDDEMISRYVLLISQYLFDNKKQIDYADFRDQSQSILGVAGRATKKLELLDNLEKFK